MRHPLGTVTWEGDRDGTDGVSGLFCGSESGPVAAVEQGQSLSEIDRALGKHAGSIHGVLSSHGGFMPPVRTRSRWALTLAEREEISRAWPRRTRSGRSRPRLVEQRRPSAGKSTAMVESVHIAPRRPTRRPGRAHDAPSPADSPSIPRSGASSRASCC